MKHKLSTKGITEKEIYRQILKEIARRGYGLLLAYTGLGAIDSSEPCWTEVMLTGENYHYFFLMVNPKSIPHFDDPMNYFGEEYAKSHLKLMEQIRTEKRRAIKSGRFVYSDKERVGLREAKKAVEENLDKLCPELVGKTLYILDISKIDPAAEYWSEVENAVKAKYGRRLGEFLKSKKSSKVRN